MAQSGRAARSKAPAAGVRERRAPATDATPGEKTPGKVVATARDRLVRGVLSPVNAVLLTRRHIEEVLDDAVARGRMTRADAQDMIQSLLTRGARATDD